MRSESKKIVPHEAGFAANLLFPEDEGQQWVKKAEVQGNVSHEEWQGAERAAGQGSVQVAHLRHREVEYVDGQKGSRPARGRPKEGAGAAGKKIDKESSLMQTKSKVVSSPSNGRGGRSFGKPSGLKMHSDSEGVASVLGSPSKRPTGGGGGAYEAALAEGRAMLGTPYTASGSPKTSPTGSPGSGGKINRGGYQAPKYGMGDAAGNFRKERSMNKPNNSQASDTNSAHNIFGAPPPFGVDAVTSHSTNTRFATSSSSIGGRTKDRITDYTTSASAVGAAPPTPTAMVLTGPPAAGQRPKVPLK